MKNHLFFNGNILPAKVFFAMMMLMMSGLFAGRTFCAITGNLPSGLTKGHEIWHNYLPDDPKCTNPPSVTTLAATSVTATSATLNGIVNPNSGWTYYHFRWGTSTAYGNTTKVLNAGNGTSDVNVSAIILDLSPNTTYHFCLVASNMMGTTFGTDSVFISGNITVHTNSVNTITYTSAISGGNIISYNSSPVTARGVCWGTSEDPTILGQHTINGSGDGAFTSYITGLSTGTLYYVRAYATNANGTFYGCNKTFTTLNCGSLTIPFLEEFSAGSLPDCWTLLDHLGNGGLWQFGTISAQSPNPLLNGTYAYLNSNAYGSGNSQNTDLLSPVFNFSENTSVTLLFNHFILCNNGASGTLSYSLNLGINWTIVQAFTTTSLTNPDAFSQDIPALAGQPQVMFKWNYTGTFGSYWAIDDVQVTGTLPDPTLSVTPSNYDVSPVAGYRVFTVVSNTSWSAASDKTWCTVTPSGTGDGSITAIYTENNTGLQRLANITVTVAGLSPVVVIVTQAALPLLSVSPANRDVPQAGGSTTFIVTTPLSWSATSDQLWCTVTPSGTGNGVITVNYENNSSYSQRIANITVTVAGVSPVVVTVTQAALPLLSVSPANRDVPQTGGSTTFIVTTPLSWSATSNQLWCTVTPSGTGNGVITADYETNPSSSQRIANITVTAEGISPVVVTVTQFGTTSFGFIINMQNIMQTAPNVLEFDIYILDTDPSQDLEMATSQYGINYNVSMLNGAPHLTGMTMVVEGSSQLPASMAPLNANSATAGLIRVAGRAAPGCGSGFIISKVAPGTRVARFRITHSVPFAENSTPDFAFTSSTAVTPSYATRFAHYEAGTCLNVQLPVIPGVNAIVTGNPLLNGPPELEVVPGSQTVGAIAGESGFTVNSNTGWTAYTDQPWVTVTPSGFGDGTMNAVFTENTSEQRTALITVSAPGLEDTEVMLSQEGISVRTLNLNLMIEGLYAGNGTMNQAYDESGPHFEGGIADMITVELHNSSDYSIVEHAVQETGLSLAGIASVNIPASLNGAYYITIKHRNSIETTSAVPVSFDGQNISYSFDLPAKAYGSNLLLMSDGHYVIQSGDVNQDGLIDTGDMTLVDNDAAGYSTGYIITDLNGDGVADTADMTIVDNNSAAYVMAETP